MAFELLHHQLRSKVDMALREQAVAIASRYSQSSTPEKLSVNGPKCAAALHLPLKDQLESIDTAKEICSVTMVGNR